ncbi:hypothetical protein D3C71_1716180 [compost metagenome]
MAGQVDEQQVFRAAAFGQGQGGAAQVLAGGHRPVTEVFAMIDQADLAVGAEAAGEHVADVVGLTQEYALFAITAQCQAVQLDRRC